MKNNRHLCGLLAALFLTFASLPTSATAAEGCEPAKEFEPLELVKNGSVDGPQLAMLLTQTFLSEEEFKAEVNAIRSKFQTWEKDNGGGDIGQYLNDRLILVGLSAANGKVEKIQKGILWLAFYKEFNQEAPAIVVKFLREHQESLAKLFTEFNWDKASLYVKNREWRRDYEERRKVAAASKKAESAEK